VIPQDPTHPPAAQTQPKTEPQQLILGFWPQSPPPGLALANAQCPRCLHIINSHPPPPSIISHCYFTRHAQNRATNARFQDFGPKPRPAGVRPNEQPQPQPHLTYLTPATPQHHPHRHFEWCAPKRATTTRLMQPNT
jgi:hypothetical protein